ncbi:glycosyltransferase family 4 protein [Candidatus Borrarchaeum sp.]|uniref:glycosyltransferase family 4 protein n=1 Tax=Candidatus Borrarchaeum sp. TaxID=2846742 RepID=UPI00257EA53A|nr:glycosyltransferase family 4 protein [Candidatus Borrarchaeum sp.]
MKIALLHAFLNQKGGAENLVLWYSRHLIEKGHDVTIFTARFDYNLWLSEVKDLRIIEIPWLGDAYFLAPLARNKLVSKLSNFDIINFHNLNLSFSIALANKLSNKDTTKMVWYCHEPHRPLYHTITDAGLEHLYSARMRTGSGLYDIYYLLEKLQKDISNKIHRIYDQNIVNKTDLILANSNYTSGLVKRIYNKDAKTCYPGIDITKFSDKGKVKESLNCENLILTIGFLRLVKNFDVAIKAMQYVVKTHRKTKLVIVGSGPERYRLLKLVKKLHLERNVLIQQLADKELVEYYGSSDVVLYIPFNEPFGLVPLEAMASKKPVVASNLSGPTETVQNNRTGFLVDPKDPKAAAIAICRLLEDKELSRKMGEAGRKHVEDNFTLKRSASRFEDYLVRE